MKRKRPKVTRLPWVQAKAWSAVHAPTGLQCRISEETALWTRRSSWYWAVGSGTYGFVDSRELAELAIAAELNRHSAKKEAELSAGEPELIDF